LRIQRRIAGDDGTAPYRAVFDEVVAQLHVARVQPGAKLRCSSTRRILMTWRSTGSAPVSSARRRPVRYRVLVNRGRGPSL
jgi:hypothetical protein